MTPSFLRYSGRISALVLIAFALSGCAWLGDLFGAGKRAPDEFVVVNKRPLTVPPDFQLRPPEPGKPSPQNIQPAEQVFEALFPGRSDAPTPPSLAEGALLRNFAESDSDVRSTVGDESRIVHKGPLLREILSAPVQESASDGATIEYKRSEDAGGR